uniref:ADP-ribosylation factor-like 10 n=1 Tax=Spermophilus dauricus TaxID=99837 RepID=A0A8C9P5W1_SPEDA
TSQPPPPMKCQRMLMLPPPKCQGSWVLVLGLDGSGKSTFLRVLSGKPPLEGHIPTWGFNSVRLPTKDFEVDLLEIGGSQNLRFYWKEFVNEVDVLVFMVDSADRLRLPWARQELHKLLDKDPDLPVVVVANKQVRAMGGNFSHMPGKGREHYRRIWVCAWRT